MGNTCSGNTVLDAEFQKFTHLQAEEATQSKPTLSIGTNTAHFTKQTKTTEGHGPEKADGEYVSQPVLTPGITAHMDAIDSSRADANLRGRELHKPFLIKKTGVIYEGEWRDHKPHGFGRNYYPDGSFFIGDFVEGVPNGHGKYFRPNGDYYEGDIKAGRANGNGIFKGQDYLYRGEFRDDKSHGKGEETSSHFTFKGQYERGQKLKGTMTWGSNKYTGDFENDLFDGKGVLTSEEGTYEGDFKAGLKHGQGEHKWKDGSYYKGEYAHDLKSGYGQYISADKKYEYLGYWSQGTQHGGGACKVNGDEIRGKWNSGNIVQTH